MNEISTLQSPTLLSPTPARPPRRRTLIIALVAGTGIAVILGWGLASRGAAEAALKAQAAQTGVTVVVAAHPKPEASPDEVVLPGQVKGEFETTLYARTNGYLHSWTADIGTHVKAGQLLAVIDSPEIDQQLLQAEADLKTTQANAGDARTTADRVAGLVDTHSVSRQEGDDRAAAASATAAQVAAQQANVGRLRQLKGFERVVAPFDGVITSRTTDVGALINAGGAQGAELFRIAAMNKLRTYVEVPQSYAAQIHVGTTGELQFPDRPGKLYPATVTRTASAIDPQARTLQVELDIDNSSGELLPGSFTQVHFKLPPSGVGLRLPGSALLFRADGVQVAKVGPNGRVVLTPITLGRDFGDTIEVLTGVTPADQVILDPPAAVANGDPVRVAAAKPQKAG